jgi:hypothetical protein
MPNQTIDHFAPVGLEETALLPDAFKERKDDIDTKPNNRPFCPSWS